jgi:molybdopterin converting factor small subunit
VKVKVRLLQPFKGMLGKGEATVDLARGTVDDALVSLCERHEVLREDMLDPEGRVSDAVSVILNDRPLASVLEYRETRLKEGDEIVVFRPISGGA